MKLSLSEVYKIRREERKAEQLKAEKADPELGPHARELFYFGQRLRDLARVPLASKVVEVTREKYEGGMWRPWASSALEASPRDSEEETVAEEWGFLWYDARKHPLFPIFRQHLSDHQCWKCLDQMTAAFNEYGEASRRAYRAIQGALQSRLPNISDEDAEVAAISLLSDGFYRKLGGPGLNFSYEPHEVVVEGQTGYRLRLGAWGTSLVDDPAKLKGLATVHQKLYEDPPFRGEFDSLAQARRIAEQATAAFQKALSPDGLLRKLILDGRCNWCR